MGYTCFMPKLPVVPLSAEQRRTLEAWVRAQNTPQGVALRSRIVLLAADGKSNSDVARQVGVRRPTVLLWRERFLEGGAEALTKIAPGRGRRVTYDADRVRQVVQATVQRIWSAHGLQPHRTKGFKLSKDLRFTEKLTDVVGLYLNPPDKAIVLCVDEKSQIQALQRTQPGLPMKKGRCGTMTHDYKRHGTTTLFAALNVLDGRVIGECMVKHRHREFLRFLRQLEREFPKETPLHLIVDNYGTHNQPKVKAWLEKHPRFMLHFTPTSSSWLNLVERWFRELTEKRVRRGS